MLSNLVGLLAGAGIVALDNFAFQVEVSPIVIVALLLIVVSAIAMIWGEGGAVAALIAWLLPTLHVVKRLFNQPYTLHPNTYASILKLAAFCLVVTAIAFGMGLLLCCIIFPKAYKNA